MRILMLGNSFTFYNDMPSMLADLTGAEVVHHTRGGAHLAEQANPKTEMGAKTLEALGKESWDYVVLQEQSNAPITSKQAFLNSVKKLCEMVRAAGAIPVLFATWAYQKGSEKMNEKGIPYDEMATKLSEAYHDAARQNDALIAEVGEEFYKQADKINLYAEDGKHPSEEGSRIAARTIAAVILQSEQKKQKSIQRRDKESVSDSDTRLRIMYMYQLLLKYSDEEHPLTTNQIRELMEKEHGISMHRTTVPKDVDLLIAAGFPIQIHRARANQYYLEEGRFELPELKVLIDAVESSKFITEKKSRALVEKLISLTSETNAAKLKRNLHTSGRARSDNEKGYYIIDAINEAINARRKISLFYTDYDGEKKQILRNEGRPYIVSPYMLVWNGDYYYLVGYYHEKERVRTFRVDRILSQPAIIEEDAIPVPEDFDIAKYTKEVFRMYDTEELKEVTLLCENSIMKGVIDQFGVDIPVKKIDDEHFRIKVNVCTSPTFYSWVFQWEGRCKIQGPQETVQEYQEKLQKASA